MQQHCSPPWDPYPLLHLERWCSKNLFQLLTWHSFTRHSESTSFTEPLHQKLSTACPTGFHSESNFHTYREVQASHVSITDLLEAECTPWRIETAKLSSAHALYALVSMTFPARVPRSFSFWSKTSSWYFPQWVFQGCIPSVLLWFWARWRFWWTVQCSCTLARSKVPLSTSMLILPLTLTARRTSC